MKLIDGKKTASTIKSKLKEEIKDWVEKGNKRPHLAAVLVGENTASQAYIRTKIKSCEEVGMDSTFIPFNSQITEEELLIEIDKLNANDDIDGFIVQLPVPKHIDENKIIQRIDPKKDVDGFHPVNLGKMMLGLPSLLPATPFGIVELLRHYQIETSGKHCVVLGRSNIVGTPISLLLSRKSEIGNCTVTLAHSRTINLSQITQMADILIVALGIPEFVTAEMIKPGCVIIDVGINRKEDSSAKRGYRLVGDVNFQDVSEKVSYITPVPGGVGPMTVASLIANTFKTVKWNAGVK
jgi:methylenetetrahydrofolate dehydrogenase (NADP+)/methenyltetrahydrofolate cyclohydrolase